MLTIYSVSWCPHCRRTVDFLVKNKIDFKYLDIESQPEDVVQKVIDANGGLDWVVPTIEFEGQWRPGKKYNEGELRSDLKNLGVMD